VSSPSTTTLANKTSDDEHCETTTGVASVHCTLENYDMPYVSYSFYD
jgi:hypothetical protein